MAKITGKHLKISRTFKTTIAKRNPRKRMILILTEVDLDHPTSYNIAQSAGAVEYTDCTSAEG